MFLFKKVTKSHQSHQNRSIFYPKTQCFLILDKRYVCLNELFVKTEKNGILQSGSSPTVVPESDVCWALMCEEVDADRQQTKPLRGIRRRGIFQNLEKHTAWCPWLAPMFTIHIIISSKITWHNISNPRSCVICSRTTELWTDTVSSALSYFFKSYLQKRKPEIKPPSEDSDCRILPLNILSHDPDPAVCRNILTGVKYTRVWTDFNVMWGPFVHRCRWTCVCLCLCVCICIFLPHHRAAADVLAR